MAAIIRPKRWSRVQPPEGVQIDWGHPLAQGLIVCVLPTSLQPAELVRSIPLTIVDTTNSTFADGKRGKTFHQSGTGNGGWKFVGGSAMLPTASVTVLFAQRKFDATARSATAFGVVDASGSARCGAHVPFNDGTVYWDFGGSTGSNRLTKSSATFGDDVWAFTAGRRGSAIYQNGVLVASQATAITRTASTGDFWIGNGNGTGLQGVDLVDRGFFYVWNRELTQSEIQWLNIQPYALLAPQAPRTRLYLAPSTVSYSVSLTDTVSISDSVTRTATDPRALSDTVAVSDTAARTATDARALADTVAISDTVSRTDADPKSLTDTIPISDTISRTAADSRALADTVPITDALSRTAGDPRTLADSVPISDSIDRLVDAGRLLADTVPVSDIVLRQLADARALADLVAISDTLTVEVFGPSSPGRATGTVTRSNRAIVTVTYARRVTASTDRATRLSGRAQRVGSP